MLRPPHPWPPILPLPGAGRSLVMAMLAWPLIGQAQVSCGWDDINESAHVATVAPGAARVHFVGSPADTNSATCPGSGTTCQLRAFVVPGDAVLTGPVRGSYTCAGYLDGRGRHTTIDWLPTASLRPLPTDAATSTDWTGHWRAPEQDIAIRAVAGGALKVDGDATWGAGDPVRVKNGGVNIGNIEGTARPVDGVLAFTAGDKATLPYDQGDPDDCRVRMVRRGPYLVVRDNTNCGGHNVTFTGLHVRAK